MKIRVLVADDSPFICRLLTHYLESDPEIDVVGVALNGKEAMDCVEKFQPDVMTLDINMPKVDGLDALGHIMSECPIPVLLISGVSRKAAEITGRGLSLGAVDFILKYAPGVSISPDTLRRDIVSKVRAAARVKVIRSIPTAARSKPASWKRPIAEKKTARAEEAATGPATRVAVVGASTGGPLAVKALLSSLKAEFDFSVLIVQHMPGGFTSILAEQFDRSFPFPVKEAADGDFMIPGAAYIAPGDRHLLVERGGVIRVEDSREINGHRPSIDVAMQSAAQVFGSNTIGVVLSGMGDDGTQGMLAIKHNCGTMFAQSPETCVIDSMPDSAIANVPVQKVGTPEDIGKWLSLIKSADKPNSWNA